eukprot:509922-Rhodomonas_salina.1
MEAKAVIKSVTAPADDTLEITVAKADRKYPLPPSPLRFPRPPLPSLAPSSSLLSRASRFCSSPLPRQSESESERASERAREKAREKARERRGGAVGFGLRVCGRARCWAASAVCSSGLCGVPPSLCPIPLPSPLTLTLAPQVHGGGALPAALHLHP